MKGKRRKSKGQTTRASAKPIECARHHCAAVVQIANAIIQGNRLNEGKVKLTITGIAEIISMIKLPNTVIVVVISVRDKILIVTLVALYRIAEAIAAKAATLTTSKPGRRIMSAPQNPTAQATQVFRPALSPRTKTAARIVKSAFVNCNA